MLLQLNTTVVCKEQSIADQLNALDGNHAFESANSCTGELFTGDFLDGTHLFSVHIADSARDVDQFYEPSEPAQPSTTVQLLALR